MPTIIDVMGEREIVESLGLNLSTISRHIKVAIKAEKDTGIYLLMKVRVVYICKLMCLFFFQ